MAPYNRPLMQKVRVGLLGLGTVGSVVAEELNARGPLLAGRAGVAGFEITGAAVRDLKAERAVPAGLLSTDASEVAAASDLVIELMGGDEPAHAIATATLKSGRSLVTANKQLIAQHLPELQRTATAGGGRLRFEAAVGGGLPVVGLLSGSLRGDRISSISAVLNGTSNFIIDRMALRGSTFEEAVAEAQRRGFAEADPGADVEGHDSAAKIAILSSLAGASWVDPAAITTLGITALNRSDFHHAEQLGYSIRLVAMARWLPAGLAVTVLPTMLPKDHPLASTAGAGNRVMIESDLCGTLIVDGAGAGGRPTAASVLNDLCNITADRGAAPMLEGTAAVLPASELEMASYLRVVTTDPDGAEAQITQMLEDRGVNVILASPRRIEGDLAELVILTAPSTVEVAQNAAATVDALPAVSSVGAQLFLLPDIE
jgi:homoserine dehydrogenase